jgi:dihydroflavonol-4-reductase
MTAVITGASGHVGANLVRALIEQGRRPRCLVHVDRRALEGLDVELVTGSIDNVDALCRAFDGAGVVFHLAACISLSGRNDWPRVEAINVVGTRNVIEACRRAGVHRLVYFSSIHALKQAPLEQPVDESRPLVESRRCPPYDRSKAAAELEMRRAIEAGLDAVIIYPTAIIGPHDYQPSYLGRAILAMARDRLPAIVTGGFDWVDVRDVVAGALNAEKQAPPGSRYLLSGHWLSMCEMAARIREYMGSKNKKPVCPLWLARLGAPVVEALGRRHGQEPLYTGTSLRALRSNRRISHGKAARELGYRPRPFQETLVDTLDWFGEQGRIEVPSGRRQRTAI